MLTVKPIDIDNDKIDSIELLKSHTKLKKLRIVMGMMNYLSKLIPNYSELIVLFRDLLKNDKAFVPTTDQENALKELKIAIFSAPTFRLL